MFQPILGLVQESDPVWSLSPEEAFRRLNSSPKGLTAKERARQALQTKPARAKSNSAAALLLGQFKSPISLLLLGAAVLSLSLGQFTDSVVILAIIFASAGLGFQHEYRASRAVAEIAQLVKTQSTVICDGKEILVDSDRVLPGDVLSLSAGALIPADSLLLESSSLFVDQAALTGESFPVEKQVGRSSADSALSARTNILYAGSHVSSGFGRALVFATGSSTELGSIAASLRLQRPETDFEAGVRKFGMMLVELTLLLTLGVFAINVFRANPILESFLFALALAVGLTPQLLPAIISVNLSRGAVEMARARVIVKRLSAIENFGSMNVLCSDKTGTLTLGVVKVHGATDPSGGASDEVLRLAQENALLQSGFKNPIDEALSSSAPPTLAGEARSLGEIPYDFLRKRLSVAVEDKRGRMLVSKGALLNVLDACSTARIGGALTPLESCRDGIMARYQQLSEQGYRVLGVATKPLEASLTSFPAELEAGMVFEGYLVLEDPIRPEIASTVAHLSDLGVELKVITGDNRHVAQKLAQDVGLTTDVITGADLHEMSERALFQRVADCRIFAEIEPNQKERIILALKKRGFVVGYIGDGINDGAALHAADVGISVSNAVDVAKEAADFVMLDPALDVLARAVVEGRRTFANTMKYIFMATSANFGNMFSLAGASMLVNFLPLLPKQVLLINFLTDIPEMTIASDAVDEEMLNQPQRWDLGRLRRFTMVFGVLSSLFDYATFGILLALHVSQDVFRTAWFMESVVSASLIVLVVRSRRPVLSSTPGQGLKWTTLAIAALAILLPFTPLAALLGMHAPPPAILGAIALIVAAYFASAEGAKRIFWRRELARNANLGALKTA